MVISGDQSKIQAYYRQSEGKKGNIIHEFLNDYGFDGFRLYRFCPSEKSLEIKTLHPIFYTEVTSSKYCKSPEDHQFCLPIDLLS